MSGRWMNFKGLTLLTLCFMMVLTSFALCPVAAVEANEGEPVQVGWFESDFYRTGPNGERSGYSYDYLQAVAAHTGWRYEYVRGEWPALLQQLKDGEIDLLAAVSYKPEREKDMLFTALPMGQEKYYIYGDLSRSDLSGTDFRSFRGKRIGAVPGSFQEDLLVKWTEENKAYGKITPIDSFLDGETRVLSGELDCVVASEAAGGDQSALTAVTCVGGSDIYFAVNQQRPELKEALDSAMSQITGINPYFTQGLHQTYISSVKGCALSREELNWLAGHGPIRIAYQRKNLAFSGEDPETGELIGALAEYINFAGSCLENGQLTFEAVPYNNTSVSSRTPCG